MGVRSKTTGSEPEKPVEPTSCHGVPEHQTGAPDLMFALLGFGSALVSFFPVISFLLLRMEMFTLYHYILVFEFHEVSYLRVCLGEMLQLLRFGGNPKSLLLVVCITVTAY